MCWLVGAGSVIDRRVRNEYCYPLPPQHVTLLVKVRGEGFILQSAPVSILFLAQALKGFGAKLTNMPTSNATSSYFHHDIYPWISCFTAFLTWGIISFAFVFDSILNGKSSPGDKKTLFQGSLSMKLLSCALLSDLFFLLNVDFFSIYLITEPNRKVCVSATAQGPKGFKPRPSFPVGSTNFLTTHPLFVDGGYILRNWQHSL